MSIQRQLVEQFGFDTAQAERVYLIFGDQSIEIMHKQRADIEARRRLELDAARASEGITDMQSDQKTANRNEDE